MTAEPRALPGAVGVLRTAPVALLVAAVAGALHAGVSLYWSLGGTALVETIGQALLNRFADRQWLLLPVAAVKLAVALLPLWLARRGGPWRTPGRALAWAAAVVLVVWGGLNTVVGNLVLAGVVETAGDYDHAAMVGHAWLWDPLFLLWGGALALGLFVTRRVGAHR